VSVYRPKYRDPKTGELKQQSVYWYKFSFAGRQIRESSKSERKTIAVEAEKKRRLELERGFNSLSDRRERIRAIAELADEFLEGYKVLKPKSATFATYAVSHVKRLLGRKAASDITDAGVVGYQAARLKEKASPKSINEECGFLLRLLGEQGDYLRAKLRRKRALKLPLPPPIGKAFSEEDKQALLAEAKKRRSPSIYPALCIALNCGLRDAEIRGLTWERVDLAAGVVTVGDSKSKAGEGRTIPLNSDVLTALVAHEAWFRRKFGPPQSTHYLFPAGQPQPTDPSRPTTSFKTAWALVRENAGVTGRWHDVRHSFVTGLSESPDASEETIRQLAGHVSKAMLQHYSHIRMAAKRRAVDSLVTKKPEAQHKKKQERPSAELSHMGGGRKQPASRRGGNKTRKKGEDRLPLLDLDLLCRVAARQAAKTFALLAMVETFGSPPIGPEHKTKK
jgi:integrase